MKLQKSYLSYSCCLGVLGLLTLREEHTRGEVTILASMFSIKVIHFSVSCYTPDQFL